MIQRGIEEAKLQLQSRPKHTSARVSDSPLSEENLECKFSKKFAPLTFGYYSGTSDPVQHIRHLRDKMVFYSRNDPLMCLIFQSSLKGVALNWFYSLSLHSLDNFDEVTKAFLTRYASCREAKKNNHHLLTIKLRQGGNLKFYIGYF